MTRLPDVARVSGCREFDLRGGDGQLGAVENP